MRRFLSLFLARFNQFSVPLIIYPLCVSNVGLDNFGFIAFCTGISAFIAKIISFNMDTFSARTVNDSMHDPDLLKLSIVTPMFMKVLFSICIIPFYIIFCVYQYHGYELLTALFSLYPIISTCLSFNHYVVGTGEFKLLFQASLIEKILLLILILTLVNTENDFWLISFSYLFSTCVSILYFFIKLKAYKIRFELRLLLQSSRKYLTVGKWLLAGKCLQLHMNGAKIILGLLFDYKWVAIYDVCEKIINVSKVPLTMVGDFLFSRKDNNRNFYLRFFCIEMSISMLGILFIYFFGDYMLMYFSKDHFNIDMSKTLTILSFILLATPWLIVFGGNYIVKEMSASVYGKLLFSSNIISILFLLFWYFFTPRDFYFFVFWVVFCEYIFAALCSFFVFFKTRK